MSAFAQLLGRLAAYSDAEMAQPWEWPGRKGAQLQVRDCHWRIVETEQAFLATVPAAEREAAAVMELAQIAFGDLRGLLAGQTDDALDAKPGEEWSLREVLGHVLMTERRYAWQVRYAVNRDATQPTHAQPPVTVSTAETDSGVRDWIDMLEAERARSDSYCSTLDAPALARPSVWMEYEIDVRFRLHRFAAHLAEHTIQAEKTLRGIDRTPAEARQLVRVLSRLRGRHERRSSVGDLEHLDTAHMALAASLPPARR
ncbi:MAG TPA: DinB family protein [Candidatus Dormibacteraeota bacterium]